MSTHVIDVADLWRSVDTGDARGIANILYPTRSTVEPLQVAPQEGSFADAGTAGVGFPGEDV
jgi:hypothetical protein